jgi:hypothetical protein
MRLGVPSALLAVHYASAPAAPYRTEEACQSLLCSNDADVALSFRRREHMLLRLSSVCVPVELLPKGGGTRSKKALEPKLRSWASSEQGQVPWRLPLLLMSKVGRRRCTGASQTDQIREGAELFAVNSSPCHGPRMQGSESAFDLRKYLPEQRDRLLNSVTRGLG